MTDDDVATVAARLTAGQRTAMASTLPGEVYAYETCPGAVRVALFTKGLFACSRAAGLTFYELTELGERVHHHLQETPA